MSGRHCSWDCRGRPDLQARRTSRVILSRMFAKHSEQAIWNMVCARTLRETAAEGEGNHEHGIEDEGQLVPVEVHEPAADEEEAALANVSQCERE